MNKAVAFFEQHAGFSYDPENETEDQGRARCAKELAAAEARASEEGVAFRWSEDLYTTSADWKGDREDGGKYRDPWSTWQCVAVDADGEETAALCGIDFGRGGEPWGEPYRRVVEAELASEHFAMLRD